MNEKRETERRMLRDLVADRVEVRWERFEAEHPHLAAAIDRVRLVDSTVERLSADPEFRRAMDQAARDEAVMDAVGRITKEVARWVDRAMGLVL